MNAHMITLGAASLRRYFALGVLFALGALLLYLGLGARGAVVGQIALIVLGLAVLAAAWAFHQASARELVWDGQALQERDGRTLCTLDQIKSVDRGAFAFKPSNGFLLTLHSPAPRHWAPGLWWRWGRYIGVGGVTHAQYGKAMAEAIAIALSKDDDHGCASTCIRP
jgi:hypothetical protein